MLSNTQNIKEGKEAFEDEINVNIDKTEDVDNASKHGIEKIDVEICVFVENTVSKCSVLTESSTSTQTPPSPLNAMLSSILNILIHKFFHYVQILPQYSQFKLYS